MSSRVLSAAAVLSIFFASPLFPAERNITEITPIRSKEISAPLIMTLDILPGAGHFYFGNYFQGSVFAAAKIGGFAAGYWCFQNWRSKKAHEDGSSKKAEDTDRAAQRLAFAAIGNAVVYGVSWFMVYNDCRRSNLRAQPVFEVSFAGKSNPAVSFGFNYSY